MTPPPAASGAGADARADVAVAGLLVVAAALLRMSALAPESLWLDDSWISMVHRVSAPSDIWRIGLTAPGFAFLLKAWFSLVGLSEVAAQALPFAAGLAAPPLLYLVARRMGLRMVAAALAGIVLVLSPAHVEYSGRVKQFAPDALGVTLVLWLAWRAVERPDDARRWIAVVAMAMGASILSASVVPAVAAILVAAALMAVQSGSGRHAGRWVGGYLAFAVSWGWIISRRLPEALHDYWAGRYLESPDDVPRIARKISSGLLGLEHPVAVTIVLALLALGTALALRGRRWFVAVALAGPIAGATVLAALGAAPLGTGRTDLYLYPCLALLLAWTVDRLDRPRWWVAPAALVLLVTSAVPPPVAGYPQEQTKPLVEVLERELGPDDEVVLSASARYGAALYGPWTAGIEESNTATGFSPTFSDDRVRAAPGIAYMDALRERIRNAAPDATIWLLTTIVSEEQAEVIRTTLSELGCSRERSWRRPGAVLERWGGCRTGES